MKRHCPQEYANALGAKLATRSRHVCMFLGAGCAKACGLPDVVELQELVQSELEETDRRDFDRQLKERNIEQALSRLRRISELITGGDTVDGITAGQAKALDAKVCRLIVKALEITRGVNLDPVRNLAAWLARAGYRLPVELFTVNYDLLLETALEGIGVPYFDGFVGNLQARFRTELVEAMPGGESGYLPPQFVRLWKLHGSVNWSRSADDIVRLGQPVPDGLPAAIYPSDAKYEESRRVPFVVLQDRFRRALNAPETMVLIAGYSFSDDHLNEMIFDAAARCERSEFAVFCFSELPSDLCKRASRTPNVQLVGRTEAVLGGVRADWKAPSDSIPDLWEDEKLALPDFVHLASYLARSSVRETILETDDFMRADGENTNG